MSSGSYVRKGKMWKHQAIVLDILGYLPPAIHHVDGDKSNNHNDNLVVCQDRIYHHLLHSRENAIKACGNKNARKCWSCQEWKDLSEMYLNPAGTADICKKCSNMRNKEYLANNMEKVKKMRKLYRETNRETIRAKRRRHG